MVSLLYIILAILGISFLIFIHELGHYFMARRVGMRVETFSIGFGRPICSWMWQGVKWQIGWLFFGGYVKIAGQEADDQRDPYKIPDGFFGRPPIDRIKVAVMGPLVNIVFALVFFTIVWMCGGRDKHFSEFTHKIGWVDPQSELYSEGIRPGDEITAYNGQVFQSSKDHLYAPMTSSDGLKVSGFKVDYSTKEKTPFEYTLKPYPHPHSLEKGIVTIGVLNPANYVFYNKFRGQENPLPAGSPMQDSGLQYGDRIFWVDGDIIFSNQELSHVLNDHRVLLTIERDGKHFLRRVPRVEVQELKFDSAVKEELTDWQYEAKLNNTKLQQLMMIPYNLTNECVVEEPLKFIDKEKEQEAFPEHPFDQDDRTLKPNDKIIAVDGHPISTSYELLRRLQEHQVNIIVERLPDAAEGLSWKDADGEFDHEIDIAALNKIIDSIGTDHQVTHSGNYYLLNPVTPKVRKDLELSQERRALLAEELLERAKEIEGIEDPDKRAHALALLQNQEQQLLLGIPGIQDRQVNYDPNPIEQFDSVFGEIWRTLIALVSGSLNPKWVSGPIGIVQVVHDNWMIGIQEALFWLGAISLNLGILNLLPIPVLDGGTILLSLFEMVTGKQIRPKTLERLILPFAVLLIAFFIFLTYQDLTRLLTRFWHW